ncbi:MAG: glycosyltransferase [Oscillospiraceae bacterium]|nr:glycosyltransferase [Oscillospiraceae bacterium]
MISLIIPTCNAEKYLDSLLTSINSQTLIPDEIIIVDSESDDRTVDICEKYSNVRVIMIKRKDFDHGATRDMALKQSKGEIVIFMTQDALPADKYFIKNLVAPLLADKKMAVVSGRQLPRNDATKMERLVREFNYPDKSNVREKKDLPKYGIKTYYCTDVCAAYNRQIYLELGGFEYPLRTNEDMFYAAVAVKNGYKVAYEASAKVIHSHNMTLKQQYERNYIQGIEIERHKELLGDVSMNSEGTKLVKYVSKELLKKGNIISFIHFGFDCIARYLGSSKGKKDFNRCLKNEK